MAPADAALAFTAGFGMSLERRIDYSPTDVDEASGESNEYVGESFGIRGGNRHGERNTRY